MEGKIRSGIVRAYQESMGPALRPYVERAMRTWQKIAPRCLWIDRETRDAVRQIAFALADFNPNPGRLSAPDFSPEGFIHSSEQFKAIESELVGLRQEVFGKTTPPFRSVDRAVAYLKRQPYRGGRAFLELHGHHFIFSSDIPLGILAQETQRFDEETCFSQSALVGFIMVGIKPIARSYRIISKLGLPRIRTKGQPIPITAESMDGLPVHHIDIRLYQLLTDREMLTLMKTINRKLKPTRKKLSDKALRLYRFFGEYGNPPAKGKMKFWEGAFREWRRRYPDDEIRSSAAIRMAWSRLERALGRLSR